MLKDWAPSASASSTPVTVTVWNAAKLVAVKVIAAGATTPSAVLLLDRSMVTLPVGCEFSRTVNVALPPPSVVTRPVFGLTVIPAV